MKKRIIIALAAVLAIGAVLAGCGNSTTTTTSEGEDTTEPTDEQLGYINTEYGYIGDVQNQIAGTGYVINAVSAEESDVSDPFVGQIYIDFDDETKQKYGDLMTPGSQIYFLIKDEDVLEVRAATEEEIAKVAEIRASMSTFDDDMVYLEELTGEEAKSFANSAYTGWTDEQIGQYKEWVNAKLAEDSEFAESYNNARYDSNVMTAAERREAYANGEIPLDPTEVETTDTTDTNEAESSEPDEVIETEEPEIIEGEEGEESTLPEGAELVIDESTYVELDDGTTETIEDGATTEGAAET